MAITTEDITFVIAKRLIDSTSIGSYVADRIRPDALNPNESMPAIRYEMLSSDPFNRLGGGAKELRSRIQIDCYGQTRTEANAVAAAVRSSLDGYRGDLGDLFVHSCVLDNRYDRVDPPTNGSDHWRRRRTMDFVIVHTEPTPTL